MRALSKPFDFVLALCLFSLAVFVATAILRTLWNMTIPDIFRTRQITFWEAFRLLLIGALLSSARVNFGG